MLVAGSLYKQRVNAPFWSSENVPTMQKIAMCPHVIDPIFVLFKLSFSLIPGFQT